jgi:hypothetical protein
MPQNNVLVNRGLPTAVADGSQAQQRGGRYGESIAIPIGNSLMGLVEEGSIFSTTNPTISTGIASSIQTSYVATNGLLTIRNTDGANGKNIIPLWIRIIPTVAPASATQMTAVIAIDNTNRYSSGGSALTALNINMDLSRASIASVNYGALTLSAASGNNRIVSRFQLASVIPVVLDEYVISFGTMGGDSGTLGGATATRRTVTVPPVVLGPNNNEIMCLHVWYPSNATTAMSSECEICWIER